MANHIQVLLGQPFLVEIDVGVKNDLFARVWCLDKRCSVWAENHGEPTTWSLDVIPLVDLVLLPVLGCHDLRAKNREAGAFHGHDLRQSRAHCAGDVVLERAGLLKDERPASNVDVNVLGVFVVSKQSLRVFPAVQAADVAKLGLDDGLE